MKFKKFIYYPFLKLFGMKIKDVGGIRCNMYYVCDNCEFKITYTYEYSYGMTNYDREKQLDVDSKLTEQTVYDLGWYVDDDKILCRDCVKKLEDCS